jgi:hypothetical protein
VRGWLADHRREMARGTASSSSDDRTVSLSER